MNIRCYACSGLNHGHSTGGYMDMPACESCLEFAREAGVSFFAIPALLRLFADFDPAALD